MCVCVFVYVYLCVSVSVYMCVFISLVISLFFLSSYLSIFRSLCCAVCVCVCVSQFVSHCVCLCVFVFRKILNDCYWPSISAVGVFSLSIVVPTHITRLLLFFNDNQLISQEYNIHTVGVFFSKICYLHMLFYSILDERCTIYLLLVFSKQEDQ